MVLIFILSFIHCSKMFKMLILAIKKLLEGKRRGAHPLHRNNCNFKRSKIYFMCAIMLNFHFSTILFPPPPHSFYKNIHRNI